MLKINNLFVNVEGKSILHDINLEIKNHEIHAIMGPNGVGKSTICQALIGNPNYYLKGDILFNDENIINLNITERSRLGIYLINQNPMAIEGVTNAEMLRATLGEITGKYVPIFDFNKKLETICAKLNLDKSFIHRNINEGASGGERKKIELMHLYMLEPKLILLDEIDSGLDIDSLKVVANAIKEYYDTHDCSIIIITHHENILDTLIPNYVHIIKDGTIIKSGDKDLAKDIEEKGFKNL